MKRGLTPGVDEVGDVGLPLFKGQPFMSICKGEELCAVLES